MYHDGKYTSELVEEDFHEMETRQISGWPLVVYFLVFLVGAGFLIRSWLGE